MNINEIIENAIAERDAYVPTMEAVEMTGLEAKEIHKGDKVNFAGAFLGTVESVRPGTTKQILKVEEKKTEIRLDFDAKVDVLREVRTEESAAKQSELYKEFRALQFLASLAAEPTSDVEKLNEYVANGEYRRAAEYAADIAANQQVRSWAMSMVERVEEGKYSGIEAKAKLVEYATEAVLQGSNSPTYSGGFTVHNAVLQATQEATRKVAKDSVWY